MTRKRAVSAAEERVKIMLAALGDIKPPLHIGMTEADLQVFKNVTDECPKSEWTPHTLEIAALLARAIVDLSQEQDLLRQEGTRLTAHNNTPMANPRVSTTQKLNSQIINYRRTLGIHSNGKNGDKRDLDKRRTYANGYEDNNPLASSPLLARPNDIN